MTNTEQREEWQARVTAFLASGQTVAAWCRAQGIKPHQMYYWIRRLAPVPARTKKASQWLPVVVDDRELPHTGNGLLVRVGSAVIEVQSGFDPELLTAVVRVLTALC
ncbi:MAG: helix-turn-helix domain-containing protein [Limnochordales bacterium]|nr:helix-turn-helix domain-containing protein [Limnochordales bacterium]MBE3576922.1 helix-turn-helix domain-containing protein [Limnochordales bacterium]